MIPPGAFERLYCRRTPFSLHLPLNLHFSSLALQPCKVRYVNSYHYLASCYKVFMFLVRLPPHNCSIVPSIVLSSLLFNYTCYNRLSYIENLGNRVPPWVPKASGNRISNFGSSSQEMLREERMSALLETRRCVIPDEYRYLDPFATLSQAIARRIRPTSCKSPSSSANFAPACGWHKWHPLPYTEACAAMPWNARIYMAVLQCYLAGLAVQTRA